MAFDNLMITPNNNDEDADEESIRKNTKEQSTPPSLSGENKPDWSDMGFPDPDKAFGDRALEFTDEDYEIDKKPLQQLVRNAQLKDWTADNSEVVLVFENGMKLRIAVCEHGLKTELK